MVIFPSKMVIFPSKMVIFPSNIGVFPSKMVIFPSKKTASSDGATAGGGVADPVAAREPWHKPHLVSARDDPISSEILKCMYNQWELEVLYHIRPYFAGIFTYIGLT